MPAGKILFANAQVAFQGSEEKGTEKDLLTLTGSFMEKENTAEKNALVEITEKIFKQIGDFGSFIKYREAVIKKYGDKKVIDRMLNLAEMKIRPFCWQIIDDIHENFYKAIIGKFPSLPPNVRKEWAVLNTFNFSPSQNVPVIFVSFRRGLEIRIESINPDLLFCDALKRCEKRDLESLSISIGMAKTAHLWRRKEISFAALLDKPGQEEKETIKKEEDGYGIFMLPIIIEDSQKKPFIAGVADSIMRIPHRESKEKDLDAEQKWITGKIFYLLPPFVQSYFKVHYKLEDKDIEPLANLPEEVPPYEYISSQFESALRKNQAILKKPVLPKYPVQEVVGPFGWVGRFVKGEDDNAKQIKEDLRQLPDNSADFETIFNIALQRCRGNALAALDALRNIIRRSGRNFAETTNCQTGGEGAIAISSELQKRGVQTNFLEETLVEKKLKDIPGLPSRVKRSTYDHMLAFVLSSYYFQSIIESGDETKVKEEFSKYENDTLDYTCHNPTSTKPFSECVKDFRKDNAWLEQEGLFIFDSQENKYGFNPEFSFFKLGINGLFGKISSFKARLMGPEGFFIYRLFKKSSPTLFNMAINMQKTSGAWFFPEYEIVSWTEGLREDIGHGKDMHIEQMMLETYACRLGSQIYFTVDSMTGNK